MCRGNNDLKDVFSFTLVKFWQTKRTAARPFAVKPSKLKMDIYRKQLMLANAMSPTSVTEQYDNFICKSNKSMLVSSYTHTGVFDT